jgi:adenylate cyclase
MRTAKKATFLRESVLILIMFTMSVYLYYLVAVWGISAYLADGFIKDYLMGPTVHWEALILSLSFGLLLAVVNAWCDVPRVRRLPFGCIILLKSSLYLASLVVAVACAQLVFRLFLFSPAEIDALMGTLTAQFLVSVSLWFAACILGINFVMEVRRKVGPGNLSSLFTGRYRRPRMEDRIFLFLDLKASTTIAERLGPEKYSRLLRQCFSDLNDIVITYRAQIYQFVGDEVILMWSYRDRHSPVNSLRVFFDFDEKLKERKALYEREFGMVPVFRGGIDVGAVTATEVGDIKREIAYHGDPLNTAARLLELSKEYEQRIVISGKIKAEISTSREFILEHQGEVRLRGKTEKVAIFTVTYEKP